MPTAHAAASTCLRNSSSPRVSSMNASSSEAWCGVSSCRTSPARPPRSPISLRRQPLHLEHVAVGPRHGRAGLGSRGDELLACRACGPGRRPSRRRRRTRRRWRRRSAARVRSTMRWSAVSAISLIRCDETNTVRPSAASPRRSVRTQWMPSGSRPLTGSSSMTVSGRRAAPRRCPSRWPMPSENCPARLPATSCRPTMSMSSSTRLPRDPVRLRQRPQVVSRRAAGVDRPRLEQGADLVQRRRVLGGTACR